MLKDSSVRTRAYISTMNRLGWGLVIFFVSFYVFSIASELIITEVEYFGNPVATSLVEGVLSPICYMAPFFLGGICFYAFSRKKETQRILYEVKLPPVFPLLILAGFGIITTAAYLNNILCELIGYSIPEELISETYDNPYTVIGYMATALAPAFAEEFLFRGVVYGNLRPFGRTQAVLISATLFVLMHQNIGQIFYTFAAGIIMALMYELTGSIWCGVLYHMLNNQLSVITDVLYNGMFGNNIEPLLIAWDIVLCVLGFAAILVLVFYYKNKGKEAITRGYTDGREGLPSWAIRKGITTSGMLVFSIASILSMLFTYLMIILLY